MTRTGFALFFLALVGIDGAGCRFHAEEPRQRQDYSDPPVQYGETRFAGMRLPSPLPDGGSPDAPDVK